MWHKGGASISLLPFKLSPPRIKPPYLLHSFQPPAPYGQKYRNTSFTMPPSSSLLTSTHARLLSIAIATLLFLCNPTPSHSSPPQPKVSAISAAPASAAAVPKSSSIPPALAPDVMPLFPSPGGEKGSAPEGTLPTIPSSPSPPNPDDIMQPNSAITPSGSGAATSAASSLGGSGAMSAALAGGLVLMWSLELVGK